MSLGIVMAMLLLGVFQGRWSPRGDVVGVLVSCLGWEGYNAILEGDSFSALH